MDSCRTRNFALSFLLVLKQFTRAVFFTTIRSIEHYASSLTALDNQIGVDGGSVKATYDKFGIMYVQRGVLPDGGINELYTESVCCTFRTKRLLALTTTP